MSRLIAVCGLICSDCGAYLATQADDPAALEKVAAQWRLEYNAPNITVAGVACDGCLPEGRKCAHCAECQIRACGLAHGVANCAYCADYATCAKIAGFFQMVPAARVTLDGVRAAL
jgi:hypothetical protein